MHLDPRELFLRACRATWRDGRASRRERRQLERLRAWLAIPAGPAQALEDQARAEISPDEGAAEFEPEAFVRGLVEEARAGGRRLPPSEVTLLEQLAATFEIPPTRLATWMGPGAVALEAAAWMAGATDDHAADGEYDFDYARPPLLRFVTVLLACGGGTLFLLADFLVPNFVHAASPVAPRVWATLVMALGLALAAVNGDPLIGFCWDSPGRRSLFGLSLAAAAGTLGAWALVAAVRLAAPLGAPAWLGFAVVLLPLLGYVLFRPAWAALLFAGSRYTAPALSRAFDLWEGIAEMALDD